MAGSRCLVPLARALALLPCAVLAGEADYEIVARFPPVVGELVATVSGDDAGSGLHLVRRSYVVTDQRGDVVTHVAEARCGGGAEGEVKPFIVAIQLRPKALRSFAEATLFDIYVEVYVRDREGRVRLYREVTGHAMIELTERLRPACLGI